MNIKEILELLVAIVPPLLTLMTIIIVKFLIPFLKTKTELNTVEERRAAIEKRNAIVQEIKFWVIAGVQCAEQIYSNLPGNGTKKKDFVLEYLQEKGLSFEEAEMSRKDIDVLIEAAVLNINIWDQEFLKETAKIKTERIPADLQ